MPYLFRVSVGAVTIFHAYAQGFKHYTILLISHAASTYFPPGSAHLFTKDRSLRPSLWHWLRQPWHIYVTCKTLAHTCNLNSYKLNRESPKNTSKSTINNHLWTHDGQHANKTASNHRELTKYSQIPAEAKLEAKADTSCFPLKRGKSDRRALASSFTPSFGKWHCRWERLYIPCTTKYRNSSYQISSDMREHVYPISQFQPQP